MQIKAQPEDFVVKEHKDIAKSTEGDYSYWLLKKRNLTTNEAVKQLAEKLHISKKHIGYAGNKDKKAITEQYISLFKIKREAIERLQLEDMELIYVTQAKERITLGDLVSNSFVIVVRNLEERDLKLIQLKNYFGEQRFGKNKNNQEIGKKLVQGNFKEVCKLLDLEVQKNDCAGALRKLDLKTLRFYVHSYQSDLWNEVVRELKELPEIVPILGYLTELKGEVKKQYEKLLKEDGVKQQDFLVKSLPELASEGAERKVQVAVKDFISKWEEDEFNKGKKKVTLAFTLPPGAYATMVVKQLFEEDL